ncbi:fimbria/pilus outer membrane usher protein [Enterobacteriaceae bacterium C23F]
MVFKKKAIAVAVRIALPVISVLHVSASLAGDDLYFDTNALHLSNEQKQNVDLSALSRTDVQLPGVYDVQVNVNRTQVGKYKIRFAIQGDKLMPGLTTLMLEKWGVKVTSLSSLTTLEKDQEFFDLPKKIKGAEIAFDFSRGSLSLSLPQAVMKADAQGDVPPDEWDYGLPMFYTDYSLSGSRMSTADEQRANTTYLNLRSGLNIGGWRLRNYSYYSKDTSGNADWNSLQSWVEKDIPFLRARVVAGETSTPGLTMENFSFRGISLATQDEMLPDSQQGYAPEVRGVAMTNATVEIRQNGNLLYQTFVSPGEFVINDLYPTTSSGDLTITVREEDGTVRSFIQAYASPPVSVRKGMAKYSLSLGKYGTRFYKYNQYAVDQNFTQGEASYGLLQNMSVYGGAIMARHYQSGRMGVGLSLGRFGATSLDTTYAKTAFSNGTARSGNSVQLKYSKFFSPTSTSVTMAGYRYNAGGYYAFDEASNGYYNSQFAQSQAVRHKTQVTINQSLGEFGSLSLSANQVDYRHNERQRSLTGSWSKSFDGISLTVNQSKSEVCCSGKTDNITSVSISIPLGRWLPGNSSISLNNSYSHANSGSSLASTLSGTALADNNLAWSASGARNSGAQSQTSNSVAFSSTYSGSKGSASLGYSRFDHDKNSLNWGLRGSVIAHPYGVTLTRQLPEGSGYALVRAQNAEGAEIKNTAGLTTDFWGNAVVPSLMPYRRNDITVDTSTLGDDVDILTPQQKKVPGREALVLAEFKTRVGHRLFLTLSHQGALLPMGTEVSVGEDRGIINESGQLYLSGVEENSRLEATLDAGKKCTAKLKLDQMAVQNGILFGDVDCV